MMASGNTDLRTDFEEELTCPICLEIFEKPKLLTKCLHSFCEKCLIKLLSAEQTGKFLICPTCREVTEVPDKDISNLPNNFIITNLSLALALHSRDSSQPKLRCSGCTLNHPPVIFCNDCGQFLCQQCTEAHRKLSRIFENHVVLTLEEVKEKGVQSIPRKVVCKKHPKKDVEVYCDTCEDLVCHLCAITNHKKHEFVDVEEAYEREKDEMQRNICKVDILVPELEEALTSVMNTQEQLVKNANEKKKSINDFFCTFAEVMEERKNVLLNDVEEVQGNKMKVLNLQREDLELKLGRVQSIQAFSQRVLNSGNPPEYLSLKTTVINHLQELADQQFILKLQETSTVNFGSDTTPEEIVEKLAGFGQISTQQACGTMCEVRGLEELNQRAAVNMPLGFHTCITVKCFDNESKALNFGGDEVSVSVTNKENGAITQLFSVDNNNGSYEINVGISGKGAYEMSVLINGQPTMSSPYQLNIDSWRIDSSKQVGAIEISGKKLTGRMNPKAKTRRCAVVGDVSFQKGQHLWDVKVNCLSSGCVLGFGVSAENDLNINGLGCTEGQKWVWFYEKSLNTGCRYCSVEGETSQHEVSKLQKGDILTFLLDCDERTLTLTNTRSKESEFLTDLGVKVTPYFYISKGGSFSLH